MLTVRRNNTDIVEQDYATYDGKKVGMLRQNSRNEDLMELAAEKNFPYEPVYYDQVSELKEALEAGEIDMILPVPESPLSRFRPMPLTRIRRHQKRRE